jgi:hypothetical protein
VVEQTPGTHLKERWYLGGPRRPRWVLSSGDTITIFKNETCGAEINLDIRRKTHYRCVMIEYVLKFVHMIERITSTDSTQYIRIGRPMPLLYDYFAILFV